MIAKLLVAGVAIGALAASGATAKVHHSHHATAHGMGGVANTYAAPAQPIPYADVDHYLHASRAERQSMVTAAASSSATSAAQPAAAETSAPATTESQPAAPSPAESQPPAATPPAPASESPPMTPPATTTPPNPPQ